MLATCFCIAIHQKEKTNVLANTTCHFTIDIRRMSSSVLMSRVLDIGELRVSVFSLFICCVVCCSPFYYLINVCTVKQHLSLCVCSLFFYWHSMSGLWLCNVWKVSFHFCIDSVCALISVFATNRRKHGEQNTRGPR
jgi:hypothetical protein